MSFQGYVDFKQQLIDTLSGPIANEIAGILSSSAVDRILQVVLAKPQDGDDKPQWTAEDTSALLPDLLQQARTRLPSLIGTLSQTLDQMASTLVKSCAREAIPDGIDAMDWLDLRDASVAMCRFDKMVEREKNFFRGIVATVRKQIGSSQTTPHILSDGSQS